MKRIVIPVLRASFFLLFCAFSSVSTYSQALRFDDFASQIDRELRPMKPHQVAVLDFRTTGDSGNLQGHYLAWLVSEALSEASNRSYKVANHKSFEQAYAAIKKWTFRPATRKKDGTPVAVAVPIEVTFRRF